MPRRQERWLWSGRGRAVGSPCRAKPWPAVAAALQGWGQRRRHGWLVGKARPALGRHLQGTGWTEALTVLGQQTGSEQCCSWLAPGFQQQPPEPPPETSAASVLAPLKRWKFHHMKQRPLMSSACTGRHRHGSVKQGAAGRSSSRAAAGGAARHAQRPVGAMPLRAAAAPPGSPARPPAAQGPHLWARQRRQSSRRRRSKRRWGTPAQPVRAAQDKGCGMVGARLGGRP